MREVYKHLYYEIVQQLEKIEENLYSGWPTRNTEESKELVFVPFSAGEGKGNILKDEWNIEDMEYDLSILEKNNFIPNDKTFCLCVIQYDKLSDNFLLTIKGTQEEFLETSPESFSDSCINRLGEYILYQLRSYGHIPGKQFFGLRPRIMFIWKNRNLDDLLFHLKSTSYFIDPVTVKHEISFNLLPFKDDILVYYDTNSLIMNKK